MTLWLKKSPEHCLSFGVYNHVTENFAHLPRLAHYFLYLRRPLPASPFWTWGSRLNTQKFKNQYNYG